ncbi:LOW QUALITY PROTEIN: olfactory receptor 52N5-like [Rhinatrema bivittatum]|uniref:olfactory receptor 52N5-like n=1 Tax=Rhinatrema bivittatum TaxID=194408 RepID=UPI00112C61F8|nr:olfactory receptor 52N5-like [Rhinatrema bivittatum]XP_029457669.1 LOW QUALITY PROTEIN: olfactory receptor 52N5-like [Rhinatrema bivittatum]
MSALNNTHDNQFLFFILKGIPGLEAAHIWISIPFCTLYVTAVIANSVIIFIIQAEASLHQPMYFLLSMLSGTDIILSTSVMPKMLSAFWFNSREIYFEACLIQMFFVHTFTSVESGVLMLMAVDRYVAVCNPLRYTSILTNPLLLKTALAVLLRSVLLAAPFSFLVKRLPFCRNDVIAHTYCEHMSVAKLACADIKINTVYGISVALFVVVLDMIFIALSYILILKAVIRLSSKDARMKAFSTCTAHVTVIAMFYTPLLFTVFLQRVGHKVSPSVHIIVANLYLIIPPTVNPIVYGVNTRQIRERIRKGLH